MWIASGHRGGLLQLWDTVSSEPGPVLQGHTSNVLGVAFSPNGQWIASASWDTTVKLWDASTGALILNLRGHNASVRDVDFSPNGLQIASGGDDMKVRLWDLSSSWLSNGLQGHQVSSVLKTAYSPDGISIFTASKRSVQQWDSKTRRSLPMMFQFPGAVSVKAVEFSPDGNQIAAIVKGEVQVWNRRTCTAGSVFKDERYPIFNVVYSPCGRWIAAFNWKDRIWLWDLHDTAVKEPHVLIEFKTDDHFERRNWIASGSQDRTVRLWHRRQEGEADIWLCAGVVRAFFGTVLDIAWNPITPMEFVTHCLDHSVQVWRMSIDGEGVVVKMLWGYNIGNLCAEGLIFKDATDLSPMNQKLLVQRGAVDSTLVPEGEGSDA
ncbi:hypothetical protein BGZ88_005203 [Linnemannia elongata]|nr:hypothetical protein BGZ88_005203 [Linnemannia elongata]